MNLHKAFQTFLSSLKKEREKAATCRLEQQLAKTENLDKFLAAEKAELGLIEYSTTHGFRVLCPIASSTAPWAIALKSISLLSPKEATSLQKLEICPIFICKPSVNHPS